MENAQRYLPHMLLEDVRLMIMPVGGESRNRDFQVAWSSGDQEVERLVAHALEPSRERRHLADAAYTFFSQCAENILIYDKPVYELVYLRDAGGTAVGIELDPVSPQAFRCRGSQLIQFVPPEVARERGVPERIPLPPERTLVFRPPDYLGGELAGIMSSLAALSVSAGVPGFAVERMTGTGARVPFDLDSYQRTDHLAMARAARAIGWNARGLFAADILDHYYARRHLWFQKFLVWLRRSILHSVNEGLARAGRVLGLEGHLRIEGLPDLQDIWAAEGDLESGAVSPNQAVARFNLY